MRAILCILTLLCLSACQPTRPVTQAPVPALIPLPVSVTPAAESFTLRDGDAIAAHGAAATEVARRFADLLAQTRGLRLREVDARAAVIEFVVDPTLAVAGAATPQALDEAYELRIDAHKIVLTARTPHGLFDGSMTLWQWLTAQTAKARAIRVPGVRIADYPRFAWRGLMLDSARHFQSPEFVKKFIAEMARHKLDVLHWHLTDDQGWRIQIKKYPELASIGAWRTPASLHGGAPRYGGLYTQDDIRDIVRYAAQRFVAIVPEIEMPGHAQAAIAAYPQFGVTGKRPAVSPDWGVHTYLYNVDDATFSFLEDVLGEVMDLFPGTYIHIGGDEAAKDQWQASAQVQQRMRELGVADANALQGYFTARIGKFLAAHGRRLIGWDEILEGGVPADATVMSWQGEAGGIAAAREGHDVVMAPSPLMYFDHVQSTLHDEPPGRPDVVSLADVYAYEPVPHALDEAQARHVLGAQANLWTEYMDTPQRVEHAAFPRAAALAEVLWSPPTRRDWQGFLARLPEQFARYRLFGIAYADSVFAPRVEALGAGASLRRNSDELRSCNPGGGLPLRLPGPALGGGEAVYRVDIFDPCWIYPQVDLDKLGAVDVVVAERPYNFQLWHDADKVVLRKPAAPGGELLVYRDACKGDALVRVPLAQAANIGGVAQLHVALPSDHGTHDLCFAFGRASVNPLWMIDTVQLQPR
ncbi:MAG: beta-N-acetylhexosaminidase [Proteobacteria bacterium]|nr:beta-N-acetylhexosaminidase [Pseudomonadota bacterium]